MPPVTVENIIEDMDETVATPEPGVTRIDAPRRHGQPEFPDPGIYFGMTEDDYHSIHACSASGLKKLSVSSMDYWANSPLNVEREDESDSIFKAMGRAYHCRICEGREAYAERYCIAPEKEDYADLCVTVKDIRAAIETFDVKPKGAAKEPLIEQLLELHPEANVWDLIQAKHEEDNRGKTTVSAKTYRRIEIAAAMIGGDPQLGSAFTGGHAEVSVFWYDEATGIPCKARFDYIKMGYLIDLKSFSNMQGKPIQRAIDTAISNQKYYVPVVFYLMAIEAAKKMVIESKGEAAFNCPKHWAWEWAHQPEPQVLFVFQQTGVAPVTRGRLMPKGSTYTVTEFAVRGLMRKWRRCVETYGVEPWLDVESVVATVDEELNQWAATDFGAEIN